MLGTSGSEASRLSPHTASARILPRLDLADRRRRPRGQRVDLAAEQRRHRRPAALVGDVEQLDVRRRGEDLHRHVQRAVDARRAVVDRAGLGLRRVDQVLQRLVGTVAAHHQHGGIGADQRDRRELVELVGRRPALQAVGHRQHRDRRQRHQDRVAVGRRARGLRGADRAAGAGLVHHHDRLLQELAHHVRRPAGR